MEGLRWVGDRVRDHITGMFGASGENENGRRVVDFYTERGLCKGNIYFKQVYTEVHSSGWR